jgi:Cof subfamily protein (haloacid dehalogenase superfamily)
MIFASNIVYRKGLLEDGRMRYKLICIDMDGTLLDDKGKISEENMEAIKKAYDKGIMIAIATGRGVTSAEYHLGLIGVEGSNIFIFKCPLTMSEVKNIYEVVERHDIKAYFNTIDTSISNRKIVEEVINRYKGQGSKIQFCEKEQFIATLEKFNGEILKVSIINENNIELFNRVKKELKDMEMFEVVDSNTDYVEIMKNGCSKGRAVKMLAEIIGITRDEVVCIGDNENDIAMIEYAGLGIAMGNGCELLKKQADYITDTNFNSGVAKAINKILSVF